MSDTAKPSDVEIQSRSSSLDSAATAIRHFNNAVSVDEFISARCLPRLPETKQGEAFFLSDGLISVALNRMFAKGLWDALLSSSLHTFFQACEAV